MKEMSESKKDRSRK